MARFKENSMNNVPPRLRKQLAADPEYARCALAGHPDHECGGRVTWEHAIIVAGKQVQERWAIVPVCAAGQEVDDYQDAHTMDKDMNKWVALNRATDDELEAISRAIPYIRERARLNSSYGPYRGHCALPSPIPNITPSLFPLFSFA